MSQPFTSVADWINARASELATEHEKAQIAAGGLATLDWNKFFFRALVEYIELCDLQPKKYCDQCMSHECAQE